jgi:hypothetical protein
MCHKSNGPSYGNCELVAYPNGNEKELLSYVDEDGYKIPGKVGEINPLTGDTLIERPGWNIHSKSTLKEIEVWEIMFLD